MPLAAPLPGPLPLKTDPLEAESSAPMSPETSVKIERYIQQLVDGGYPEDKAREHALEHIDKF